MWFSCFDLFKFLYYGLFYFIQHPILLALKPILAYQATHHLLHQIHFQTPHNPLTFYFIAKTTIVVVPILLTPPSRHHHNNPSSTITPTDQTHHKTPASFTTKLSHHQHEN